MTNINNSFLTRQFELQTGKVQEKQEETKKESKELEKESVQQQAKNDYREQGEKLLDQMNIIANYNRYFTTSAGEGKTLATASTQTGSDEIEVPQQKGNKITLGEKSITIPNGFEVTTNEDGTIVINEDGTITLTKKDGDKIVEERSYDNNLNKKTTIKYLDDETKTYKYDQDGKVSFFKREFKNGETVSTNYENGQPRLRVIEKGDQKTITSYKNGEKVLQRIIKEDNMVSTYYENGHKTRYKIENVNQTITIDYDENEQIQSKIKTIFNQDDSITTVEYDLTGGASTTTREWEEGLKKVKIGDDIKYYKDDEEINLSKFKELLNTEMQPPQIETEPTPTTPTRQEGNVITDGTHSVEIPQGYWANINDDGSFELMTLSSNGFEKINYGTDFVKSTLEVEKGNTLTRTHYNANGDVERVYDRTIAGNAVSETYTSPNGYTTYTQRLYYPEMGLDYVNSLYRYDIGDDFYAMDFILNNLTDSVGMEILAGDSAWTSFASEPDQFSSIVEAYGDKDIGVMYNDQPVTLNDLVKLKNVVPTIRPEPIKISATGQWIEISNDIEQTFETSAGIKFDGSGITLKNGTTLLFNEIAPCCDKEFDIADIQQIKIFINGDGSIDVKSINTTDLIPRIQERYVNTDDFLVQNSFHIDDNINKLEDIKPSKEITGNFTCEKIIYDDNGEEVDLVYDDSKGAKIENNIMYLKNGNQIDFNTQPWNEYSLKVSSTALLLVNDKDRSKVYEVDLDGNIKEFVEIETPEETPQPYQIPTFEFSWLDSNNSEELESYYNSHINEWQEKAKGNSNLLDMLDSFKDGLTSNYEQGGTGDCWFLSSIGSFLANENGKEVLESLIHFDTDEGVFKVSFANYTEPYDVSIEDLAEHSELSDGNIWVRALEVAALKYSEVHPDWSNDKYTETEGNLYGGFLSEVQELFFGDSESVSKVKTLTKENLLNTFTQGNNIITLSNIDINAEAGGNIFGSNDNLYGPHEYAVLDVDENGLTITNPWDGSNPFYVTFEYLDDVAKLCDGSYNFNYLTLGDIERA